jgi:hypothetical protein
MNCVMGMDRDYVVMGMDRDYVVMGMDRDYVVMGMDRDYVVMGMDWEQQHQCWGKPRRPDRHCCQHHQQERHLVPEWDPSLHTCQNHTLGSTSHA